MLSLILTSFAHASSFMPPQASTMASSVDRLYAFLLIISAIASVLVIAGMLYFVFKYKRKSDNDKTAYITHNHLAEFLWSFIPLVLFMVAFVWGWKVYHDLRFAPENSYEIFVRGQKWFWEFEYKNGHKSSAELYVPVGRPVKLLMTSSDVIHSFFIPSFRVKQDVVPGMYSTLWFEVKEPGEYQVFCTEYCGLQHSSMMAKVIALPQKDFEAWVSGKAVSDLTPAQLGEKLYVNRNCNSCHSTNGSPVIGPTFKGAFGATRQFDDGSSGTVDENYLRESILNSQTKIVKGYTKVMPVYQGVLEDNEVNALIEFIKSLK
jgi:cytochrome c oxidase subunit II